MHRAVGAHDVTKECEQRSEQQLRDGDRVAGGCIDDGHAKRCRRRHVHIVHADAGAPDDAKLRGGTQQVPADARRAAADDGVILGNACEQLRRRQGRHLVDLQPRFSRQQKESIRIDLVRHQHAIAHSTPMQGEIACSAAISGKLSSGATDLRFGHHGLRIRHKKALAALRGPCGDTTSHVRESGPTANLTCQHRLPVARRRGSASRACRAGSRRPRPQVDLHARICHCRRRSQCA